MSAAAAPMETQTVSMTDEAELERLGAQGVGDVIYDDATDPTEFDEFSDVLSEFGYERRTTDS